MKDISRELIAILDKYGTDYKRALQENSRLDYLYALSDIRENLLEWYPFPEEAALLQVGSDYGALTGLYSRRVRQVVVLDESEENLHVNRRRQEDEGRENITYIAGSLPEYAAQGKPQFDIVVLAGSLMPPYEDFIRAAKSVLKPDGRLITAVCNQFGMKYWAGAKKDEHSFSKRELTRLLTGNGQEGTVEYYYPMPDYRLPSSIYSDSYLPVKGDLTNTLTVYDYPDYLLMDIGAAYDAVCEDGQFENFSNSFLTIWHV